MITLVLVQRYEDALASRCALKVFIIITIIMITLVLVQRYEDAFASRCALKVFIILISHHHHHHLTGGRNLLVRAPEFKSEDPGFDPLVGLGERQFFCPSESTVVQTSLCLTPLRVYGTHPHLCARYKDPTFIYRKRLTM